MLFLADRAAVLGGVLVSGLVHHSLVLAVGAVLVLVGLAATTVLDH